VANEDLILDRHAVTDERVALDFATRTDDRASLDLDIRTNASVVADLAAVQIRERINDHVFAELDVGDQSIGGVVYRAIRH
jgi:hypothetical protein